MLRYPISLFLLSLLAEIPVTAFEQNSGYNTLIQQIHNSPLVYKKVSSSPNTLTKISESIAKSVHLRTLIESQKSVGTYQQFDDSLLNITDVPRTTNTAESLANGSTASPNTPVTGSTNNDFSTVPITEIPRPSTPVSQLCLTHIETVIQGLTQKQKWALKMIDAAGKPPADIMDGNLIWLGDYEECLSVAVLTSLNETSYSFGGQYCLISIPVNAFKTEFTPAPSVSVGLCLPDSCTTTDTRNLINSALLELSNNSLAATIITCQEPDGPYDARAIIVLVVISLFIFIMTLGTAYDVLCIQWPKWRKLERESELNGDLVVEANEKAPLIGSKMIQKQEDEIGIIGKVLVSFSIYTNGAKILSTDQGAGSLTAINGIRFLSMTWVILGHSLGFIIPISDNFLTFFPRLLKRITFMAISNALVSVDTFFTLSGILLTYLIMKELKRTDGKLNWGMFYFHRFWRLTPPYMLVLIVHVALFPYSGSGPIWPRDGIEPNDCNTWYYNLLYVNNFIDEQKMCFGWSWYLANDMQFFVLSPLILMPLFFFHAVGVGVLLAFLLGTWITTGVMATTWGVPMSSMDGGNYMSLYDKPYFRMGPYLVGMYTGYLLYRTNCRYRMNKFVNLLGWIVAAVVACLVLYGQYDDINYDRVSTGVASLYNTVHRTVWGACVCWVVFACANGYGGFVNTILSWKGLIPLSRLTYCAYLVHPIVIYYYQYTRKRLFHFTDIDMKADNSLVAMGNYMSLYDKPYFRMGPYLVGMYTGYLLYRTNCRYRMNKFVNLLGWIVAAVVACLVLYGQYDDINYDRVSTGVASLYNTVHRTVWGACVCWVVFACANGYGGFVNTILSWKGLIPLSRLTYCAYLVHPIVIYYYQYTRKRLFHFTDIDMIYLFLGHLVVSYAVAFVTSLAFESPMMGLEKVIFKGEKRKR